MAPVCFMDTEDIKAQRVLQVKRRPERTCPQGYLVCAACRDYTAPGHQHISILCLHRSDSGQGRAPEAASPDNPHAPDMSPPHQPLQEIKLCKLCLLPLCSPCFAVLLLQEHTKLRDIRNQLNYSRWVQNTLSPGGRCAAGDRGVP